MPFINQLPTAAYTESAFPCYAPLLKQLFGHANYTITSTAFFSAFAALPELSQHILRLRFERGHKFREISIVVGVTGSSVNYWFNFGKNNLRRTLNPDHYRKKGGATTLQWVREA
jgi:DNA-directed RNA polymerase specialized sigma24 family protein